jgi:transcriptional regulator with XRE-family HTH domain
LGATDANGPQKRPTAQLTPDLQLISYNLPMPDAASLIKNARCQAGLSQAQLARRLGVSQAAVAKLERPGTNPTVATVDGALRATGQRLELGASPWKPSVDETLIAQQLRMSPEQRLAQLEGMYEWGRELAQAGARARGELA